jgi:hypothetical protein
MDALHFLTASPMLKHRADVGAIGDRRVGRDLLDSAAKRSDENAARAKWAHQA